MKLQPFHAAFPVADKEKTKSFYKDILGCTQGREDTSWIDINFFGHQLVFHQVKNFKQKHYFNPVDTHQVPVPHFGVVLNFNEWQTLAARLEPYTLDFEIEPYIRFEGQVGEQGTMFFYDINRYALEFKAFKNPENLFKT